MNNKHTEESRLVKFISALQFYDSSVTAGVRDGKVALFYHGDDSSYFMEYVVPSVARMFGLPTDRDVDGILSSIGLYGIYFEEDGYDLCESCDKIVDTGNPDECVVTSEGYFCLDCVHSSKPHSKDDYAELAIEFAASNGFTLDAITTEEYEVRGWKRYGDGSREFKTLMDKLTDNSSLWFGGHRYAEELKLRSYVSRKTPGKVVLSTNSGLEAYYK